MPSRVPSPSKQQLDAIATYTRLLDEAKVRLVGLTDAIDGKMLLPEQLVADFCYLELRMLCELVALGCLVAHGDIEATISSKLQKEYAADSIVKKLEQLHQNFYPRPVTVSRTANGHHIERIESGYLSKSELTALYHSCGDYLHRGSLTKFRSTAPKRYSAEREKLIQWQRKFVVLLTTHHIASLSNQSHYLCYLSHEQAKGTPCANMTCDTYPREISEQRGRYDDQPSDKGSDASSAGFFRSRRIARSP